MAAHADNTNHRRATRTRIRWWKGLTGLAGMKILKHIFWLALFAIAPVSLAQAAQTFKPAVAAGLVKVGDDVIWEQDADVRLPQASLTKIMTALLILENYEPTPYSLSSAPWRPRARPRSACARATACASAICSRRRWCIRPTTPAALWRSGIPAPRTSSWCV